MRLIDADELWNKCKSLKIDTPVDRLFALKKIATWIKEAPAVEQKHGHWIVIEQDVMGCKRYRCSNCGKTDDDYSEPIYCKRCGAANGRVKTMDGDSE